MPIGTKIVRGQLLESRLPDSDVTVYFVQQNGYFDREQLYQENGIDYKDNCERFIFFSRAVLDVIRQLDFGVDILHCNDWQTGLIPAYLDIEYSHASGYDHIASIMTIHNMAYQGRFWHWDMLLTGLDWKYFNWQQMEFYGDLNLLKTGLSFSDAITTVSRQYAEEIQQPPLGCGMEGLLQQRGENLSGIINGVSYDDWNPATDKYLSTNFDTKTWQTGKPKCKAALQELLGLPTQPDVPLIGLVGRLADQKGWDLIVEVMQRWAPHEDAQWAILGTGDPRYHESLSHLAQSFPQRVGLSLDFSNELAHQIEAGADMFLMPSRYEPCGLNQLYSLKYGTVPVVRATGGLADTITDSTPETLEAGTANGFSFINYDADSLAQTLGRACETYRNEQPVWNQLVTTGMNQDWSWQRSAEQYIDLYTRARSQKEQSHERIGQSG